MVRIARFGWDESLGPVSQILGRNGDAWDAPPVERDRENPNTPARKRPKNRENDVDRKARRSAAGPRRGA